MAALALAVPLTGCGRYRNLRLEVPGLFGMERVSANLWVEPRMPAATRAELQRDLSLARWRLELHHGPLESSPRVVAGAISEEAAHSEANWQEIQRRGLPTPYLDEMITFDQISEAIVKYGDTRADSAGNLHVVYTTAAHEVRGWLAHTGCGGVLALVAAMKAGEPFGPAYARLKGEDATRR